MSLTFYKFTVHSGKSVVLAHRAFVDRIEKLTKDALQHNVPAPVCWYTAIKQTSTENYFYLAATLETLEALRVVQLVGMLSYKVDPRLRESALVTSDYTHSLVSDALAAVSARRSESDDADRTNFINRLFYVIELKNQLTSQEHRTLLDKLKDLNPELISKRFFPFFMGIIRDYTDDMRAYLARERGSFILTASSESQLDAPISLSYQLALSVSEAKLSRIQAVLNKLVNPERSFFWLYCATKFSFTLEGEQLKLTFEVKAKSDQDSQVLEANKRVMKAYQCGDNLEFLIHVFWALDLTKEEFTLKSIPGCKKVRSPQDDYDQSLPGGNMMINSGSWCRLHQKGSDDSPPTRRRANSTGSSASRTSSHSSLSAASRSPSPLRTTPRTSPALS